MKKIALFSVIALSALMVGCSSTQCRDNADCDGNKVCATEACDHANTSFECPNCEPGKPCCADCAAKAAASCPDCAAKAKACADAAGCSDCADGKACAKCDAKKSAKACSACVDGVKCDKCSA